MSLKFHRAGAVTITLLVCSGAGAQMRGGGSYGGSMAAHVVPMRVTTAPRIASPSSLPSSSGGQGLPQARVIQIAPNGRVTSRARFFSNPTRLEDDYGVPGLGFDYSHLAAVSGSFRFNPPGFGRGSHRQHSFETPVFFGGYPYYYDSPDYQPEQQQPQVIVIQQPVPAEPVQPETSADREAPADTGTPAAAPAPVREVGELILVRRDGRVLFASIFSVTGAQLQYVTPEGIRHTLPLSELDTVATQEMNEARGTTLQFHN